MQSERSILRQSTLKGRINLLAKRFSSHRMCCKTWQCFLTPRMTCEPEPHLFTLCFSLHEDRKNHGEFHHILQLGQSEDQASGHCTVYTQSWPADPNPIAVHEGITIIFLSGIKIAIDYLCCRDSQESQTWSMNQIMPGTVQIKSPCPNLEAICVSGCNLASDLEFN